MRVRSIGIISLLVTAAACTGATGASDREPAATSPAHDVLALGTADGAVILGSASGRVLATVDGRVTAPDGSRVYAATWSGRTTTVEALDPSTGAVVSTTTLEGRFDVRAAALSGRAVALMRPLPDGVDPTIALPRARTAIVVADPSGEHATRRYRLSGNFEPEAFSIDDTRLFLIQYLPAEAPVAYRVTFLDLGSGRVHPVFGRFASPPERMPGIRLAQVFDPVAEQLYTLYTNRVAEHFHDRWEDASYGDREVSFVHVLNLREGWAYCAGLPRELWGQPATAQAIAPSPDGRRLYVVDSVRGLIAEMDTRSMEITRSARVDVGRHDHGRTSASMSTEGDTLYVGVGGTTISRIDVETLEVVGTWTMPADVRGLASSEDGARLYAALRDGVALVDTETGAVSTLPFRRVEAILHVATS